MCTGVDCQMTLLKYVQREGPVLKCDALSRKETKHVNKSVRQALVPGEQAKVDMKHSVTRGSYTGYTPEERAKIGRIAAKNGPARATRHFAMPETTTRRLKYDTCREVEGNAAC